MVKDFWEDLANPWDNSVKFCMCPHKAYHHSESFDLHMSYDKERISSTAEVVHVCV